MADQAPNIDWLKSNSKWVALFAVVSVGLWYVLEQVNPDTIAAYMVKEERKACELEKMQDNIKLNKCLSMVIWNGATPQSILRCGY
jgi:hypothetical protein